MTIKAQTGPGAEQALPEQSDSQRRDMHPATSAILEFFAFDHLPEPQRDISRECAMLAHTMAGELGDTAHGAELTTGLRKLLEAKDCFVRASLRSSRS